MSRGTTIAEVRWDGAFCPMCGERGAEITAIGSTCLEYACVTPGCGAGIWKGRPIRGSTWSTR